MEQIRYNEKTDFPGGEKKPSAYVFVTNHAFHSNLTAPDSGMQLLATGFHIPGFGPDAPHSSYKGVLETRARHSEMFALMKSMQTHYEIPSTFDGEMPQLAFQDPSLACRGCNSDAPYLVPLRGRTGDVPGRLYEAVVQEEQKQVVGCYQLASGITILAKCPISDAELAAYRAYPDTFFGEVRQPTRHAKTLVDWCDFFSPRGFGALVESRRSAPEAVADDGTLTKLAGGLYAYPKETVFGKAPAKDDKLVGTFLKDRRFLLATPNAYNSLGVGTTQLFDKTVVYNHKRHGNFSLGGRI